MSDTAPSVSAAQLRTAHQGRETPATFDSTGDDRAAIEKLLDTYTTAVTSKDQALFESLLLSKAIPFSNVATAVENAASDQGTHNYETFRKAVFEGSAFTQSFRDVRISQDGPLAQVSLVFVNVRPNESKWGWKVMQLLRVGNAWKIASEFFTVHA